MSDEVAEESAVPTKIVVGTDGSVTAGRALRKAIGLAKAVGAELIIISAYSDRAPAGVASAGIALDAGFAGAAHTAAEMTVQQAGDEARAAGVANVTALVVAGEPANSLVDATVEHNADLLVVGSKGMHAAVRFLSGPVAKKVSQRVACDLLIVETGEKPQ
jgi:nucleotide-binding universal stress UspA family protein